MQQYHLITLFLQLPLPSTPAGCVAVPAKPRKVKTWFKTALSLVPSFIPRFADTGNYYLESTCEPQQVDWYMAACNKLAEKVEQGHKGTDILGIKAWLKKYALIFCFSMPCYEVSNSAFAGPWAV
jgi:hypothetical protein